MTTPQASAYLPRHAAPRVRDALADTRVVLINGARQSGKSTLVRKIGRETGATWYTLDNEATRRLVADDPAGFVRFDERMIIDEVQREPNLLLSIKELVDEDPEPGRFLLTGSARILGLRDLPDTLVGRMETIELWPLSQGEIDGAEDCFVDVAFGQGPELRHESQVTRDEYIERIVRGGFPEAIRRAPARRADFLRNYVADLINRDVVQISEIERVPEMRALVRTLAGRSGQTLAPATVGSSIGLGHATTARYLSLLEEVFLIKRIPAWTRRLSGRSLSQQKVAMVDSGVAAAVLGMNAARLRKVGAPLGELLEGFVAMEIARQLTWCETRADQFHYRTRDGDEVDIVLENLLGEVVAIEVKASATPTPDDFRGIRHLHDRIGDELVAGYVLHTGQRTLPFGPKYRAVPVSALWEAVPV